LKLYKVTINWYGEVTEHHTSAKTETKALTNIIRRLAVKYGYTVAYTRAIVCDPNKDRWKIQEVKEK